MCGFCDVQNTARLKIFSDEDYDRIIYEIYAGALSTRNLDVHSYLKVARKLTDGVFQGYGKSLEGMLINAPDYRMLKALKESVYVFSGAKTYQQTRAISEKLTNLLTTGDEVTSLEDFKQQSKKILIDYNEAYLTTEYNAAIGQAQSVSKWNVFEEEKSLFPLLKYQTAGDQRVRPTHADLDNVVRPVGDKFWDKFAPLNGWNCRCLLVQTDYQDSSVTPLRSIKDPHDVPDIFRFNPAKERVVFSPKHPYFDVADKDKDFAKMNFNLPLPE